MVLFTENISRTYIPTVVYVLAMLLYMDYILFLFSFHVPVDLPTTDVLTTQILPFKGH